MSNNIKIQKYIVQELKRKIYVKVPKNLPLFNHNTPEFGQYRLGHYL